MGLALSRPLRSTPIGTSWSAAQPADPVFASRRLRRTTIGYRLSKDRQTGGSRSDGRLSQVSLKTTVSGWRIDRADESMAAGRIGPSDRNAQAPDTFKAATA